MSRGSYQRRVYITVLQHNEGYRWHTKYMKQYTGEAPGFWMLKMINEKTKTHQRTKKSQTNPNFRRHKATGVAEIEKDYGEEAVEANENLMDTSLDVARMKLKYEVNTVQAHR